VRQSMRGISAIGRSGRARQEPAPTAAAWRGIGPEPALVRQDVGHGADLADGAFEFQHHEGAGDGGSREGALAGELVDVDGVVGEQ
jgi:hypothetical protein